MTVPLIKQLEILNVNRNKTPVFVVLSLQQPFGFADKTALFQQACHLVSLQARIHNSILDPKLA